MYRFVEIEMRAPEPLIRVPSLYASPTGSCRDPTCKRKPPSCWRTSSSAVSSRRDWPSSSRHSISAWPGAVFAKQWRAKSHCRLVHGYSLSFRFEFEANTLDDKNWVVDFGGLKELRAILEGLPERGG